MRIIIDYKFKMPTVAKKIERKSEQRKMIVDILCKAKNHPTAKEIFYKVQKKLPDIGLATVYRNLDFLEKNKKIIKLKSREREARYDGLTTNHCHLICKKCGRILDIMDVESILIKSKELRKSKFKIDPGYAEMFGLCARCNK